MAISKASFTVESSRNKLRISVIVYSNQNDTAGPTPVVVMGHGIGGIKEAGLPEFGIAFANEGYTAVLFDYLHWGASEGLPRDDMSVSRQLQDYRDVIGWVRSQPDKYDSRRIVAWGTSFGGMHVTALLSQDHQLAAGIAQCPCVDAMAASEKVPLLYSLRLTAVALADAARAFAGASPIYVNLSGDGSPGSPLALMTGPEVMHGRENIRPGDDTPYPNVITARSLLQFPVNRPVLHIHKSTKPYLIVLPTWDDQAPLEAAERAVFEAPLGEALRVEGGHFDLYPNGPAYKKNLAGQLSFLRRVLA